MTRVHALRLCFMYAADHVRDWFPQLGGQLQPHVITSSVMAWSYLGRLSAYGSRRTLHPIFERHNQQTRIIHANAYRTIPVLSTNKHTLWSYSNTGGVWRFKYRVVREAELVKKLIDDELQHTGITERTQTRMANLIHERVGANHMRHG